MPQSNPKLVRSLVPALGEEHGVAMSVVPVAGVTLLQRLGEKAAEEGQEVLGEVLRLVAASDGADRHAALAELADLYDVVKELVWALGFRLQDLQAASAHKEAARGSLVVDGKGLLWTGDPSQRW